MGRIARNADATELRAIVSDALDDPSVELVFKVDGSDGFVTHAASRSPMPLPATGAPRLPSHARARQ